MASPPYRSENHSKRFVWWFLTVLMGLVLTLSGYLYNQANAAIEELRREGQTRNRELGELMALARQYEQRLQRIELKLDRIEELLMVQK